MEPALLPQGPCGGARERRDSLRRGYGRRGRPGGHEERPLPNGILKRQHVNSVVLTRHLDAPLETFVYGSDVVIEIRHGLVTVQERGSPSAITALRRKTGR